MTNSKILRSLIILEWVFIISGITLSTVLEEYLPEELKQWIEMEIETEFSTQDAIILIGVLPLLAASLAGSIGLFLLKKWGAWTFLASLVIGYALFPFAGATVEHPIADMVDEISVIIAGMILALAFFTETLSANKSVLTTSEAAPPTS